MNRLQRELRRLYAHQAPAGQDAKPDDDGLLDSSGRVRSMVLELARPADWHALSHVWNGVQAELELPAPAIAVSGTDGYQLWFSLAEPAPAPRAAAFLEGLRVRYLSSIKPERVVLMPSVDSSLPPEARHARPVPAPQPGSGLWSAFVAPDLAPVFADEPWLDLPPNTDGQADLLARLASMPPADFQRALERLSPAAAPGPSRPAPDPADMPGADAGRMHARVTPAGTGSDPRRFLLDVMNDDSVELALRIEAAKALLTCRAEPGRD